MEVDIANFNAPSQVVISGPAEGIKKAARIFGEACVVCIPLKVSGAFHSRHMSSAMEAFGQFIEGFAFSPLTIPVVSNVHARPYRQFEIGSNLTRQIGHPVKWAESIQYLMGQGEMEFKELGPGKVLTKLIADIRRSTPTVVFLMSGGLDRKEPLIKPDSGQQAEGAPAGSRLTGDSLGSEAFKKEYNLRYAYLTGGMTKGIASVQMVIQAGRAGIMGFFGTGGV